MPTFCRHNRFIERCPICRRTLPGASAGATSTDGARRSSSGKSQSSGGDVRGSRLVSTGSSLAGGHRRLRAGGREMRVRRETRSVDDGYRCELVPGLRASADAARLAEEIAFAAGRLGQLRLAPPDMFGEIRALAREGDLERATWVCFLTVYLCPLQGEDPFAGVRLVLARERMPTGERVADVEGAVGVERDWDSSLDGVPLGPRTSHDPARGSETLRAYRQWALHAGSQVQAIGGEKSWTPERRFERAFERLALPGLGRMGRYELLVTFGRLGLYELRAGSLRLAAGRGVAAEDLTTVAAKRIFAVGEPVYLERRAVAFAEELSVTVDVLDSAFANWAASERATLGFGDDAIDGHTLERVREVLQLESEQEPEEQVG